MGDFNFDDRQEWGDWRRAAAAPQWGDGRRAAAAPRAAGAPLENDVLRAVLPAWADLWPALHPAADAEAALVGS